MVEKVADVYQMMAKVWAPIFHSKRPKTIWVTMANTLAMEWQRIEDGKVEEIIVD